MNENTCPMTKEELFSLTLHDLKALWKDTHDVITMVAHSQIAKDRAMILLEGDLNTLKLSIEVLGEKIGISRARQL